MGIKGPQYLQEMWAFILPELLKAIEAEPEKEVLAELLASLARCIELLGAGCLGEPGMEETIKLLDKTLDQHYVRQTERAGKRQGGEEDYDEGVEEQLEDEGNNPHILGANNSSLPRVVAIIAEALAVEVLPPDHPSKARLIGIIKQVQGNAGVFEACVNALSEPQKLAIRTALG